MTLVTTGAGMSTAFAIGERVVGQALSIPPKGVDEIMSVQAVIFDWAGTMVDFGSRAPVVAMMRVFEAEGVPVSEALVRRFMGTAKREHVIAMLSDEGTGESWRSKNGRVWCEADVRPDYGASGAADARRCHGTLGPHARCHAHVGGLAETVDQDWVVDWLHARNDDGHPGECRGARLCT